MHAQSFQHGCSIGVHVHIWLTTILVAQELHMFQFLVNPLQQHVTVLFQKLQRHVQMFQLVDGHVLSTSNVVQPSVSQSFHQLLDDLHLTSIQPLA